MESRTQPVTRPATRRAAPDRLTTAMALLPVRGFLGITFVYAGIQKLSDPGFLHKGAPTYIGAQLHNFANGTPGGFILRAFAIPHPTLAGVGVALVEILVGLLVLVGLATRGAAAVGLGLNLLLFLTNSWKTSPYFLGSDIVFVFAWLPFVLIGARDQPALDHSLNAIAARRARERAAHGGPPLTRRAVLAQGIGFAAFAAGAIGGLSALLRGAYKAPATLGGATASTGRGKSTATTATNPSTSSQTSSSSQGSATQGGSASGLPSGAVRLGPSTALGRDQAATYNDPTDGNPDLLIRHSDGTLSAFSAVCTHAGCTVGYQGGQIVCPCHGGLYNAQTGAVEGGPPPAPLPRKRVIDSGGSLYAVPS
jgi:thiosulfate dehydrogenase (quinone) large subunit